jgi:NAD(P)-dependent dehydrogenase (short-subunit alcohol dehydrogenase family)
MSKWTVADIPSLEGKSALVTGANSGIGFHAARHLAIAGCAVVMGCRDVAKGEAARQRIKQESAAADVEVVALDLASLQSIRVFAESYLKSGRPLDLLINNAGVMAIPTRETTVDGFEKQFGTNHLGHFALTGLLLPSILAAPAARVVTVASIAHKGASMQFEDLQYTKGYKPWPPYGQSKLANLLFAFELDRRLVAAGTNAISIAVHPGLSKTSIFSSTHGKGRGLKSTIAPTFMSVFAQSDDQGSYPTLYGATFPQAFGGHYYGPGGLLEWRGAPVEVTAKPQARDEVAAARLWEISENLTGVHYSAIDVKRA